MVFSLIWLPEVLRGAGLKVAEQPGWTTRGHDDVSRVRGVICHHTVGLRTGNMPSLHGLTAGVRQKSGKFLKGPLAQLGLARDGTYYVIAAGLASHAGSGSWQGISVDREKVNGERRRKAASAYRSRDRCGSKPALSPVERAPGVPAEMRRWRRSPEDPGE
jgi:hypothetical protein